MNKKVAIWIIGISLFFAFSITVYAYFNADARAERRARVRQAERQRIRKERKAESAKIRDPEREKILKARSDRIKKERIEASKKHEKERQARLAKKTKYKKQFGPQPKTLSDGSVIEVIVYLQSVAREPDSLEYRNWTPVFIDEEDGWTVGVEWGGINGFGGYSWSMDWFCIVDGEAVPSY